MHVWHVRLRMLLLCLLLLMLSASALRVFNLRLCRDVQPIA